MLSPYPVNPLLSAACSNASGSTSATEPSADWDHDLAFSLCCSFSKSSRRSLAAFPQSRTFPVSGSAIHPTTLPALTILWPTAVVRRPI